MTVRIMGLNPSRAGGACLVEDGVIRSALPLARTTPDPASLVDDLLADAGLVTADISHWVVHPAQAHYPDRQTLCLPDAGHHLALASAAFYSSGYQEAAALVIDTAETGFHFTIGAPPDRLFEVVRYPAQIDGDSPVYLPDNLNGIGQLYQVITLALGFQDSRMTMDLASGGKPFTMEPLFIEPAGELSFSRAVDSLLELGLATREGGSLRLVPCQMVEQFHRDLAAQVQAEVEQAALRLAREVLARTESRSLVVSGDCFLNSMVNTRIRNEIEADRLFVLPTATGDAIAAGAALFAYHNLIGQPAEASPALRNVYLGPSRVAGRDLEALAPDWPLPVRRYNQVARVAAAAIARGEIVGWFQDRSELGPNSLGARSILCHPGIAGMKEQLNARIKSRAAFSSFAASVLAEQAGQWFALPAAESPFMQYSAEVLAHRRDMVGELVNADGTCRVQTVAEDDPGLFRGLIESFEDQTGLPMVVTTAFDPEVEYPEDALDLLRSAVLDRLFIGDLEFEAPAAEIPRQVTDPARCGAPSPLASRTLRFHPEDLQRSK
jgi:carbamoyltransferase